MQENAPNQDQTGPSPEAAPTPDPMPEPVQSGGSRIRMIVGGVVGLVVLAGVAVGAYSLLGLGGNTTKVTDSPVPLATPTPEVTASLAPGQQVALLEPAESGSGSGEAARSSGDGRFVVAVSAELPDPPSGTYYEVFLGKEKPASQFSAGKMYKVGGRWVMTLDQTRDATPYNLVTVTVEAEDDGKPEQTVLSGAF